MNKTNKTKSYENTLKYKMCVHRVLAKYGNNVITFEEVTAEKHLFFKLNYLDVQFSKFKKRVFKGCKLTFLIVNLYFFIAAFRIQLFDLHSKGRP